MRRGAALAGGTGVWMLLGALAIGGAVAPPLRAQTGGPSPLRHGRVSGRVLSPSGEPLAGAEVALVPVSNPFSEAELDLPCWFASAEPPDILARTTSAGDGRFEIAESPPFADVRLEGVFAGLEWSLIVRAPGCRPLILEDAPGAGADLDCGELKLTSGAGVRGRVVDGQGVPMAGADVQLSSGPLDESISYRASSAYFEVARTTTDGEGRFDFAASFAGSPRLTVSHRAAVSELAQSIVTRQGETTDLGTLTMTRGGRISGRVLDAQGQPLAGAQIYVADGTLVFDPSEEQDRPAVARSRLAQRPAFESSADGEFVVEGVPGPSAHLLVLAPGCDAALLRCVPAGADDLEIALQPEARLLVQVSATGVDGVDGVEIVALRASGPTLGGRPLALPVTHLGEGGEAVYSIGQVGPALTRVQVTAPGYAPAWVEADGVPAGKHKLLSVDLRPAAVLQGIVTDLEDHPLSGVSVSAMNLEALFSPDFLTQFSASLAAPVRAKGRASARTDAEGRFTFSELTPGPWTLEASLAGYARTKDTATSLAFGSTRSARLRMRPASAEEQKPDGPDGEGGVVVRGRVLSGGAPVPGAVVWVEETGSRPLRRAPGVLPGTLFEEGMDAPERDRSDLNKAACDEAGVYELNVPPGTQWRLCAASPDGGLSDPQPIDAGVDASAVIARDIDLGAHELTVVVLAEQDDRPLPHAWVWIEPAVPWDIVPGVWRTDEHGRSVIQHLRPGEYTVSASLEHSALDQDWPNVDTERRSLPIAVAGTGGTAELVIDVPRGGRIEGVVRTPTGVLVPDGTSVCGVCKGEGAAPRVRAATKNGRFALVGLRAGTWRLCVTETGSDYRAQDGTLAETEVEVDADTTARCELEVVFHGPRAYRRALTRAEYYKPAAFDSAQWKDSQLVSEGVRIRMIDDLLAKHELVGMSREGILSLLGPPDGRFTEEPKLTWYLGDERSAFAIDSEWLSLTFGEDDRVTEKRVWAD